MLHFANCNFSRAESIRLLGGKAANLVSLLRRECPGVRIPDGFVVPTTFLGRFLMFSPTQEEDCLCIGEQIENHLSDLAKLSPTDGDLLVTVRRCGETIRSLIHEHESVAFDLLMQEGIDSRLAELHSHVVPPISSSASPRYAVRSSGVAEDLSEFSFAGQMETVLNVPGDSVSIMRAIVTTWMSLFSDRALSYRHTHWKHGADTGQIEGMEGMDDYEEEDEGEVVGVNSVEVEIASESSSSSVREFSFPLLAVIVQRMVPNVVVSGVAYTADPVTSSRSSMVISAAFGLGEAIAEGRTAPDTYWIRKVDGNLTDVKLGHKRRKVVPRNFDVELEEKDGENEERVVFVEEVEVEGMEESRALTSEDLDEVVRVASQIEEAYASPQDIEFAFEQRSVDVRVLWIVQARKMTSLSGSPAFPRFFYENDRTVRRQLVGKRVFLNLNYYEVLSHPLDPFSLSFVRDAFVVPSAHWLFRSVPQVRDSWADRSVSMDGHLFLDVTDIFNSDWTASRVFQQLEYVFDPMVGKGLALLRERGFFENDDVPVSPVDPATLWSGAYISPWRWFRRFVALDIEAEQQRMAEVMENVVPDSEQAFLRIDEIVTATPASRVQAHLRVMRDAFELLWSTIAPNLIVGSGCGIVLRTMRLPEEEIMSLDSGLLFSSKRLELAMKKLACVARECGVLGEIESILNSSSSDVDPSPDFSIPAVIAAIRAMSSDEESYSAFVTELADFAENWGFRGISEMAPTSSRFVEDCSYVLRFCLLSGPASSDSFRDADDEALIEHIVTRFLETRTCCSNFFCCGLGNFLRAQFVRSLCRTYRALFKYREEIKHVGMQVMFRCRQKIFDIIEECLVPRPLAKMEDSHFLYLEEIFWCMDHPQAFEEDPTLKERLVRTIASRKRDLKAFEHRTVPHLVTSDCERVDVLVYQEIVKDLPDNVFAGIAASPGVCIGRVKLLLDPHVDWIEKGEIVVAKQIDPAMSVLFSEASGLVSEVGGLQTHGVAVAREVGIPAVVCVMDVCSKLVNGQLIRVDGLAGTVEILDEMQQ